MRSHEDSTPRRRRAARAAIGTNARVEMAADLAIDATNDDAGLDSAVVDAERLESVDATARFSTVSKPPPVMCSQPRLHIVVEYSNRVVSSRVIDGTDGVVVRAAYATGKMMALYANAGWAVSCLARYMSEAPTMMVVERKFRVVCAAL